MLSFKEYLENLRNCDTQTIHNYSLRWAIIFSIIILALVFWIWGQDIFDFSSLRQLEKINNINVEKNEANFSTDNLISKQASNLSTTDTVKLESSWSDLKNIFQEISQKFKNIKSGFSDINN